MTANCDNSASWVLRSRGAAVHMLETPLLHREQLVGVGFELGNAIIRSGREAVGILRSRLVERSARPFGESFVGSRLEERLDDFVAHPAGVDRQAAALRRRHRKARLEGKVELRGLKPRSAIR